MKTTISVARKWETLASYGLALAVGLSLTAALIVGGWSREAPKVMVGTKDVVYFSHDSTKQDAVALGEALKGIGFFTNAGAGAVLEKRKTGTVVSFALSEGAWERPDVASNFGEIGRRIAPLVGGFPFRIKLVDQRLAVRKVLSVGKETIGARDVIYYYGAATQEDALRLGHSLVSAGALKDVGTTLVLAKDEGTTISFVVKQTPWENPEIVAVFESLMRQVAPSVGGLPVKLRFLDAAGVMHKEVSVL